MVKLLLVALVLALVEFPFDEMGFVFMALFFAGVLKQIYSVIRHNLKPQKTWYLAFSIGAFLLAAFMDYPS